MTRPPRLVLVALLLAAPACVTSKESKIFSIEPTRPGFELPPRPVILFFVDGLRADVLEELLAEGELPRLKRCFFDRAARARNAVTGVPSVTYANAVSMLTGCWPSANGVWANACFDRRQLQTRNYEAKREIAVSDVSSATIFELMSDELTAGVAMPFERGVKISRARSARTGGVEFGLTWLMGREREADERLSEQLYDIAQQVREIGEWPAFIALHLPGVDDVGHDDGSDGPEYRAAVLNLDAVMGEVLEAFEQGGMLEDLTLVLTADHGHHSAQHSLALEKDLRAAIGMPVLISLENDGDQPYLARWEHYSPARVIVAPNGMREASIHLRTGEHWNVRPSLEEILAFPRAPDDPEDECLPVRLLRSPGIDLVAVRAGAHAVHVFGRGGNAVIQRTGAMDDPMFRYALQSGDDPLAYEGDERLRKWIQAGAHTSREWLEATADRRYPDLVPQLVTAFDDPRSGDLIVFAAPGWDFSKEYHGGHGGIEREELLVPLYLAGPGIRPGAELSAARLVDVVPTILELAGVQVPPERHFDGVSLAPLLR